MVRPGAGTPEGAEAKPKVTREVAAEAAVWVTRLHGPDRSPQMERDFRAWQARSAAHREAFERCTDVWLDVGKIKLATAYATVTAEGRAREGRASHGMRWWAAGAATVAAMSVVLLVGRQWWTQGVFGTDVGEQRVVMLDDGSRMVLNTDTRLRVDFNDRQRTVKLSSGEAIFEVAKDTRRPFVVRVSGSEVVAVGTVFSVRYGEAAVSVPREVAVTLIEGQVNVRRASDARADAVAPDKVVAMKAGERLRLDRLPSMAGAATPRVDRPNVEQLTAWKRSEAVFDATPMREAVAEMNRYSRTPVVLVDGLGDSSLRVSGLYRTGDNAGFARAVANLYGLKLKTEAGRLELGKAQ